MELIPRAKPIYIRIKLGDNEYSNLDDVRSHLVIKDLYPLFLDGRLARWLKQIGRADLADEAEKMADLHRGETLRDYLYCMSLFDCELKDLLDKAGNLDDNEINSLFNPDEDVDLLCRVIDGMSGVETFDSSEIIIRYISLDSYKRLLTNPRTMSLLPPDRFGRLLAALADTSDHWRELLLFLGKNQQLHAMLKEYWNISDPLDYTTFEGLSVDGLNEYYSIDSIRALISGKKWGELFFSAIKDWETDSEKVKSLLNTKEEIMSFLVAARKKGYHIIPQEDLDPWSYIHSTGDYQHVMRALTICETSRNHIFKKKDYNYLELETTLGRQIIDFLELMNENLRHSISLKWQTQSDYFKHRDGEDYLIDERKIAACILSRNPSIRNGSFTNVGKKTLDDLSDQGNLLARQLLDIVSKSNPRNETLFKKVVHSIKTKLEQMDNLA